MKHFAVPGEMPDILLLKHAINKYRIYIKYHELFNI